MENFDEDIYGYREIKKTWHPFDFGFFSHPSLDTVFYNGNYELRLLKDGCWLLRKKLKNSRGNTEVVVKFYQFIPEDDYYFAKKLLQLYLYNPNNSHNLNS